MEIRKGRNSYQACEQFVIIELTDLKSNRKLKVFCDNHKINYNTASMFLNKKLGKESPIFIKNCLEALGHRAKIHREIFYDIF